MKRSFSQRERALLGIAITLYEKLGNSTSKNLEQLNVECLLLKAALLNVASIRGKLATSSIDHDVEFTHDLRLTARDAIELTFQKAEKVKDAQQDLLIPVEATEEYEYELRALRRAFGDAAQVQPDFELNTTKHDDDTTTIISVNGGPRVPLNSPEATKQIEGAAREVIKRSRRGHTQDSPPPPPA